MHGRAESPRSWRFAARSASRGRIGPGLAIEWTGDRQNGAVVVHQETSLGHALALGVLGCLKNLDSRNFRNEAAPIFSGCVFLNAWPSGIASFLAFRCEISEPGPHRPRSGHRMDW